MLLIVILGACASPPVVRVVGEYGQKNGEYVFRECATGTEYDVTLRSETFISYLGRVKELGAEPGEMLVAEFEAIHVPASTNSLGVGRILALHRGGCGGA